MVRTSDLFRCRWRNGIPRAKNEVEWRADENQRRAQGRVDARLLSIGHCRLCSCNIFVNRENKIEGGEADEDPRQDRISRDFVRPWRGGLLAAHHENPIRPAGVKNPAYEDQHVGERIECAAEEQQDAPYSLDDKRGSGGMKARVRAPNELREDISACHREIDTSGGKSCSVASTERGDHHAQRNP